MLYTLSLRYAARKPTGAKLALKLFHCGVRLQVAHRVRLADRIRARLRARSAAAAAAPGEQDDGDEQDESPTHASTLAA